MNLNDFVVIPSNKPKSVKLSARNLRELRMETVTLAQESRDMEERLEQLRESLSREKEERARSGGFKWKSGQAGALTNPGFKRSKENDFHKLSAGKVKIRVLREQPQSEVCRVERAPAPPRSDPQRSSRKPQLRGKACGQCEARTAGLMCAECGEDYCVGCFARFHQKGALKLHRMIPIQTEIQTSVSALDVASRFQRQVRPDPNPDAHPKTHSPGSQNALRGGGGGRGLDNRKQAPPTMDKPHQAQVLVVENPGGREAEDDDEEGYEEEDEEEDEEEEEEEELRVAGSLLGGAYDEDESARSFQEALREWRVSVVGTQADMGTGAGRVPVRVEFTTDSLSYLDRLLLKKHRRTPIRERHRPPSSPAPAPGSPTHTRHEETAHCLTAEELEVKRYCASLFALPACGGSAEPTLAPGPSLSFQELDETVGDGVCRGDLCAEQTGDDNTKSAFRTLALEGGSAQLPRPDRATTRSPRLHRSPPRSPRSKTPSESRGDRALDRAPGQEPLVERSSKSRSSKAPWTPETSVSPKTSTETPAPKPQPPVTPPLGARLSLPPRSPSRLLLLPSPPPAFSLRSTFDLSPPSSSPEPLPPESPPPSRPRGPRSSRLVRPTPSSPLDRVSAPARSTPDPPNPSPPAYPPSPLKVTPDASPPFGGLSTGSANASGGHDESTPSPRDPEVARSPPPPLTPPGRSLRPARTSSDLGSPPSSAEPPSGASTPSPLPPCCSSSSSSPRGADPLGDYSSHQPPVMPGSGFRRDRSPRRSLRIGSPSVPSADSADEGSVDSLGRFSGEEDSSSDEDVRTEEEHCLGARRGDPPSTDPAEPGPEPETAGPGLASEPTAALLALALREENGPERFCGLEGFLTLGLDPGSVQTSPLPAHTYRGTQQTPPCSINTGSDSWRPSSSLRECAEEHLVATLMTDSQPIGIQRRVATPTGRGARAAHGSPMSGSAGVPGRPLSRPGSGPLCRPLSRAAQEILEICGVDERGGEDAELDSDEDAHALASLEEEFRIMAADPDQLRQAPGIRAASLPGGGARVTRETDRSRGSDWGGVNEDQTDEEEEILRDRQSVLSLR